MQTVKVPGVLWIIGVVLLVALGRTYVTQQGLNPVYVDVLVVAAVAILKALNLGTDEIEELLGIIHELQTQLAKHEPGLVASPAAVHSMQAVPPRSSVNYFMRWLVG
jgi:hypothetical protein